MSLQNAFPTHIWVWHDLEALQTNDEITGMHFVDIRCKNMQKSVSRVKANSTPIKCNIQVPSIKELEAYNLPFPV